MDELEFKNKYIYRYESCKYIFNSERGFIVWRRGTGDNVELLHIRSFFQRKGYGRCLFYQMLKRLDRDSCRPYHSIFGFTRVSNERAKEFYLAVGFNIQIVEGLYKDGQAVMFWQEYNKLIEAAKTYGVCWSTK